MLCFRENIPLKAEFCLVSRIFFFEVTAVGSDVFKIFMHIKSVVLGNFDYAAADIRAVVGNSFEIVEKVGEDKSVLNGAFTLLESYYVVALDSFLKVVDNLFKRLDKRRLMNVISYQGFIA